MARAALSAYDLPGAPRLELLGAGLTTTFRVVTADHRYVLGVHRPGYRTVANTRAELGYLDDLGKALAGTGILLPRPVLDVDGILSPTDRADLENIAGRTRRIFTELSDQFGVIHGDYILGNIHLSRLGNRWQVGVIDFGDSGIGCFVYDLCPLLGNLAGYPAGPYNPDYPELRDTLLSGYRSARPFPAEWQPHLPVLMAARHANHCFLTAGLDVSPTPREDAAWRMDLARISLDLPT